MCIRIEYVLVLYIAPCDKYAGLIQQMFKKKRKISHIFYKIVIN